MTLEEKMLCKARIKKHIYELRLTRSFSEADDLKAEVDSDLNKLNVGAHTLIKWDKMYESYYSQLKLGVYVPLLQTIEIEDLLDVIIIQED